MEKLKPCPFCGFNAEVEYSQRDNDFMDVVKCQICGAKSERYFDFNKAIDAWNRRVTTSPSPRPELSE